MNNNSHIASLKLAIKVAKIRIPGKANKASSVKPSSVQIKKQQPIKMKLINNEVPNRIFLYLANKKQATIPIPLLMLMLMDSMMPTELHLPINML